ncbi:MAG: hypothetical protein AAF752_03455 [Bacteroidota bacterium]
MRFLRIAAVFSVLILAAAPAFTLLLRPVDHMIVCSLPAPPDRFTHEPVSAEASDRPIHLPGSPVIE